MADGPIMSARESKYVRSATIAAAAVAVAAVYIAFRAGDYFPDALRWDLALARDGAGAVWHPHRLIYNALAVICYDVLRAFGYGGRLFGAMQLMDAAFGGAGAALYYLVLRRVELSRPMAAAGTLALAFSYGYWAFASNAEYMAAATFAVIAAVLFVLRAGAAAGFGRWAAAALVAGLAPLVHISNGLIFVFLVTAYLLARGAGGWRRLPLLVAIFFAPIVAGYGAVAFGVLRLDGLSAAGRWFSGGPGQGQYYSSFALRNLGLDLYALGRNFFGVRWAKDVMLGGWGAGAVILVFIILLGGIALAAAFGAAAVRYVGDRGARRHAWLAAALFVPYALYFTFRDAGGFDRWNVQLVAALFFIYAGAGAKGAKLVRLALYVLPALLFVGNFAGSIYPASRPENNEHLAFVRFLDGVTAPGDLVIFSGVGGVGVGVYAEYFAGVEAASVLYGSRDAAAFRRLVDERLAAGARVFVCDERPAATSASLLGSGDGGRYRPTGAIGRRLLAPYELTAVATYEGPRYAPSRIWELRRR